MTYVISPAKVPVAYLKPLTRYRVFDVGCVSFLLHLGDGDPLHCLWRHCAHLWHAETGEQGEWLRGEHKGWSIDYGATNPGGPWVGLSPSYDVDCDEDGYHAPADSYAYADTYEALIEAIDEIIEEQNDAQN